jgi:hypothetical protein
MENLCNRCQRSLGEEDCFCPGCGLPHLIFPAEATTDQPGPEPWTQVARDAGSVEWKSALRAAMIVAVPAGLLSSELSAMGSLGVFWMAAAAAWAVFLYWRSQRPAWITTGAGARIGLVTGLIAAWVTFAVSSASLFVDRYLLHHGQQIDNDWKTMTAGVLAQQKEILNGFPQFDQAQVQAVNAQYQVLFLSPEGHAGVIASHLVVKAAFLLVFASAGGMLGARLLRRSRRPEV